MRAAVFQGRGLGHRVETVADPAPGEGEVVVRVARSGICGSDVQYTAPREGPGGAISASIDELYGPGAVLGHEIAGEVVALGAGVNELAIGDRVAPMGLHGCGRCLHCLSGRPLWCPEGDAVMGGNAEYARISGRFAVRLAESSSWDEGALIEPLSVSYHAVGLAAVKPDDRVLVFGAGPVGLGMMLFARRAGAGRVAAVARSDRRKELALRLGADTFLTQGENLAERAAEALGGPPDVVFEAAGARGSIVGQALETVRPYGTVLFAGSTESPVSVDQGVAQFKELRLQYSMVYSREEFAVVSRFIGEHAALLAPLASDTIALEDYDATLEELRGSTGRVKVMIDPWATGVG
jgi:threonine dehydrogenase-like Zn-dependent dehydrogenase